ncbi:dTMP kinase [Geomicrobium sediminis]|uniref:Thymidylate kinase n=1 Tax=Geomicrobium sediminis TaxID=1347788 RepID=A0ABS2PJY3_9BACL|nr:dTMP kinase [Geomicrobium sediminis]MBM7635128.1 dTMP kinase [Geomicrobium sediminis]
MNQPGLFITFEGGEGAGKSTVLQAVAEQLQQKGHCVDTTREPGGVALAEKIRYYLLDDQTIEVEARTEALLFAAARRQHLIERILPGLKDGKIVLCDRFVDSSIAYQGAARGIGVEEVRQINDFAIQGRMPDITLLFDLPVEVGQARIHGNARETNRLDDEKVDFHLTVRKAYLELASQNNERYRIINAEAPIRSVIEEVTQVIEDFIVNKNRD